MNRRSFVELMAASVGALPLSSAAQESQMSRTEPIIVGPGQTRHAMVVPSWFRMNCSARLEHQTSEVVFASCLLITLHGKDRLFTLTAMATSGSMSSKVSSSMRLAASCIASLKAVVWSPLKKFLIDTSMGLCPAPYSSD